MRWSFSGYEEPGPADSLTETFILRTPPPSIVRTLRAGYKAEPHPGLA